MTKTAGLGCTEIAWRTNVPARSINIGVGKSPESGGSLSVSKWLKCSLRTPPFSSLKSGNLAFRCTQGLRDLKVWHSPYRRIKVLQISRRVLYHTPLCKDIYSLPKRFKTEIRCPLATKRTGHLARSSPLILARDWNLSVLRRILCHQRILGALPWLTNRLRISPRMNFLSNLRRGPPKVQSVMILKNLSKIRAPSISLASLRKQLKPSPHLSKMLFRKLTLRQHLLTILRIKLCQFNLSKISPGKSKVLLRVWERPANPRIFLRHATVVGIPQKYPHRYPN